MLGIAIGDWEKMIITHIKDIIVAIGRTKEILNKFSKS